MPTRRMEDVIAVVMAGGVGARLRPLTDVRAKPAVAFAGVHRIIDFTLSNCINSGLRKIFVLTQYKSHSLSNHLKGGWGFLSRRLNQYIDEIPAQMQRGTNWYRGTADAIRQNMSFLDHLDPAHVLILSGDHIYKMDYGLLRHFHDSKGAGVTLAVCRVPVDKARGNYGVIEVDQDSRVLGFEEKPQDPKPIPGTGDCFASMGIYFFNYGTLDGVLRSGLHDFGRDIFAELAGTGAKLYAFDFTRYNTIQEYQYLTRSGERVKILKQRATDSDYWRDVGTIEAYWRANLDVVSTSPSFNLYGERWPIFTCPQHLPPAKFVHESAGRTGIAYNSIVSNGAIISGAVARNSVLGPGLYVHSFSLIENSVLIGGSSVGGITYETSVGRYCRVRNAIIDKNATLAPHTEVGYNRAADEARGWTTYDLDDGSDYIVVIPREYSE